MRDRNIIATIRNNFIAGLAALLPLAVTIFVLFLLIEHVGERASDLFFYWLDEDIRTGWRRLILSLASTVFVVLFITGLGILSRLFIGRLLFNLAELFFNNVPGVSLVYKTVKQIVDTFSTQQRNVFQKTVLVEFPRKGIWVLGFLTGEGKGEVQARTGKYLLNVFVPTTPNPTSGFLLMVPEDEVISMQISITDGIKLIISGGAVVPPFAGQPGTEAPSEQFPASPTTGPLDA